MQVTAIWSIQRPTGMAFHGPNFQRAHDDWEFAHTVGLNAIKGSLCRQWRISALGWTVVTPWRVYARTPADTYRRAFRRPAVSG